jgi:hypothetical protein
MVERTPVVQLAVRYPRLDHIHGAIVLKRLRLDNPLEISWRLETPADRKHPGIKPPG